MSGIVGAKFLLPSLLNKHRVFDAYFTYGSCSGYTKQKEMTPSGEMYS